MKNKFKSSRLCLVVAAFFSVMISVGSCNTLSVGQEGQPCNAYGVCMPGLVCSGNVCKPTGGDVWWVDPVTGLAWQDPPRKGMLSWQDAMNFCTSLVLGAQSGWRLPTINELRSLISGCQTTGTGGACGVTDICRGEACMDSFCGGCDYMKGPGRNGCYWDAALAGDCASAPFWSSTSDADDDLSAWFIWFDAGYIKFFLKTPQTLNVRCVKTGG